MAIQWTLSLLHEQNGVADKTLNFPDNFCGRCFLQSIQSFGRQRNGDVRFADAVENIRREARPVVADGDLDRLVVPPRHDVDALAREITGGR